MPTANSSKQTEVQASLALLSLKFFLPGVFATGLGCKKEMADTGAHWSVSIRIKCTAEIERVNFLHHFLIS